MGDKEFVKNIIKEIFPGSIIKSVKKFKNGIVSEVFKVSLNHPKKEISVKIYSKKNKKKIEKNNNILKFLLKKEVSKIDVYYNKTFKDFGISIEDCAKGKTAKYFLKNGNHKLKEKILKNSAIRLKKIHSLNTPTFWKDEKKCIKNKTDWIKWTTDRKKEYLKFAKKNLPEYYLFLKNELDAIDLLFDRNKKFKISPLHWDYNFGNLNVDNTGKITGVFDFDNAIRGHNLADIGQTYYWLIPHYKYSKHFLDSYNKDFSKDDKNFIWIYHLMHIIAVIKSVWGNNNCEQLINEHIKTLDKCSKGMYKIK